MQYTLPRNAAAGAMNTAGPASDEVARWIVSYLTRYPQAADAPLGIQRWWLAPNFGEAPLETVLQALEQLERQGVVVRLDPSSPVYGRGPAFRPQP